MASLHASDMGAPIDNMIHDIGLHVTRDVIMLSRKRDGETMRKKRSQRRLG
jgi:hypothetical protein